MRQRIGILGAIGLLVFVVWVVGWLFLEKRDGYWHVMLPIAAILMIAQGVRRVAA